MEHSETVLAGRRDILRFVAAVALGLMTAIVSGCGDDKQDVKPLPAKRLPPRPPGK
jgi:hypothetical protein